MNLTSGTSEIRVEETKQIKKTNEPIKLSVKGLKIDKLTMTVDEMASKYGLSLAQMKLALKTAGIKLTRPKAKPKFELINDENSNIVV